MRGDKAGLPDGLKTQAAIDKALRKTLPGHDDFWPRWLVASGKVPGSLTGARHD